MKILVVIDMQEYFKAATKRLMNQILRYKRKHKLLTYFVCYTHKNLKDTLPVFKSIDVNRYDRIIYKDQDDGALVIVNQLLNDASPNSDLARSRYKFKIDRNLTIELCGVNTSACVARTFNSLIRLNPKFKVILNSELCNDSKYGQLPSPSLRKTYRNWNIQFKKGQII